MNNGTLNRERIEQHLYDSYRDPNSSIFLETDQKKLYLAAKNEAALFPVSRAEIDGFKQSIESTSRSFQRRLLRSRTRHLQYRSWVTFGPLDILCGSYMPFKRVLISL